MRRERISPSRATAWAVCLAAFSSWAVSGLLLPFVASPAMGFPILFVSCIVSAVVLMGVRRLLASTSLEAAALLFLLSQVAGSAAALLATGQMIDGVYGIPLANVLAIAPAVAGHLLGLGARMVIHCVAPSLLWMQPLALPRSSDRR